MAMPIKKNNRTRAIFVLLFSLSLTLEGREALYSGRYMCVYIYIYIYIFFFWRSRYIFSILTFMNTLHKNLDPRILIETCQIAEA